MMTLGLVDSNILALWIVGQVSEAEIPKCRRTRQYSVDDYRILTGYLTRFSELLIVPNIATEVSNLIGALTDEYLKQARGILAAGLGVWKEQYVASLSAAGVSNYLRLGLTDAAIQLAAHKSLEVLTDDLDLYIALAEAEVPVTNFTHLRAQNWE